MSARGGLRVVGDTLELRLAAAFVDRAAYPLVLDPPIGSTFTVASGATSDDIRPSVAYDVGTGRWLVVWNSLPTSGSAQVRGQLLSGSGAAVGSAFTIANGSATSQAVANVRASGRFVVVYSTSSSTLPGFTTWRVLAVAVTPATGAVSSTVEIDSSSSPSSPIGQAVVGGESRDTPGAIAVPVVYGRSGLASSIHLRQVLVSASGAPLVLAPSTNVVSGLLGPHAISAHGGGVPRWLLTWTEGVLPAVTSVDLQARALSAGGPCGSAYTLATAPLNEFDAAAPAATVDGNEFAVVWSTFSSGDVFAVPLTFSGGCGNATATVGAPVTVTQSPGLQDQPAIAFARHKYVVAYRHRDTAASTSRVMAEGIDPATCASCGVEATLDSTVLGLGTPVVGARWSGGDAVSDEALVVFNNTSVRARRFEARGSGGVATLGGSCFVSGLSDFATYSGRPVLGDATFALELASPTAPIVALVVGFGTANLPCGSCTLVPALDVVLPGVTPTPVPIPCEPSLIGTELISQWLQLKVSDCVLFPFLAMSNALKFTIAE